MIVLVLPSDATVIRLLNLPSHPEAGVRDAKDRLPEVGADAFGQKETKPSKTARCEIRFPATTPRKYVLNLLGEEYQARTLGDALVWVYRWLDELDETSLERLSHETVRTRRLVASKPEHLYRGRSDLPFKEIKPGWFAATNFSREDTERAFRRACDLFGLTYGEDLTFKAVPLVSLEDF